MFWVRKIFVSIFFVCLVFKIQAQRLFYPAHALHLSSANYVPSVADIFNAGSNCSLLPHMHGFAVALFCESRFVKEISLAQLSAAYSFDGNGTLISFQRFGTSEYSESILRAAYGKNLGKVDAGIQFDYILVSTTGYAKVKVIQVCLSGIFQVSQDVSLGIRIRNPSLIKPKFERIKAASASSIGLGWSPSTVLYTGIEVQKEQQHPLSIAVTFRYIFTNNLSVRICWDVSINQPVMILSWKIPSLIFQAGFGYNSPLGSSPSAAIMYSSPGKSKNNN